MSVRKLCMSPKPVCELFFPKSYTSRVAKILENRKPNRKTIITWHQFICGIGPNRFNLAYEIQITLFLYPLFKTLQI